MNARDEQVSMTLVDLGFVRPGGEWSWREWAICASTDPELFFPLDDGPDGLEALVRVAAAKRVCAVCPVRDVCLADVMAWEDPARRWGVVGGASAGERSELFEVRRGEVA
jgi:hypothetical protein